ncbi:hypothetical protein CK203_018142 [Vitis vinifera]|uniref:Secreted protein n=1 Tax=Vitis vinifera TaxID=29760 RepID=A0A438JPA8_VITVI|nr:hypothetical protein CK203_018142 [Vitis vinifera]
MFQGWLLLSQGISILGQALSLLPSPLSADHEETPLMKPGYATPRFLLSTSYFLEKSLHLSLAYQLSSLDGSAPFAKFPQTTPMVRPCVPVIHVAAKWMHAFNQDRVLVQSSLQKMFGQGVRTHPPMVLLAMSREIKQLTF